MEPVTIALLASQAFNIGSKLLGNRKEKRRKKRKANFFHNEISPLLDEATAEPDIDYNSIRNAEMLMPIENFQNQMRSISQNYQSSLSQSGFSSSGFLDNEMDISNSMARSQFDNTVYGIDRSIIDMQGQMDALTSQNRLRAKELEYQYLYG